MPRSRSTTATAAPSRGASAPASTATTEPRSTRASVMARSTTPSAAPRSARVARDRRRGLRALLVDADVRLMDDVRDEQLLGAGHAREVGTVGVEGERHAQRAKEIPELGLRLDREAWQGELHFLRTQSCGDRREGVGVEGALEGGQAVVGFRHDDG